MGKRIHVSRVVIGRTALDPGEAHHARDVLRLAHGAGVEVFDETGAQASATLEIGPDRAVSIIVEAIDEPRLSTSLRVRVFAAIPKGDRAEWMIEKLSELGVDRFIPLEAERSVVVPKGTNKIERWMRIATESAKQSRRIGIMRIEPLMRLEDAITLVGEERAWFLATADGTLAADACAAARGIASLALFIGPEGGWTDGEIDRLTSAQFAAVGLTHTVLRVETAAVSAAAIALSCIEVDGGSSNER